MTSKYKRKKDLSGDTNASKVKDDLINDMPKNEEIQQMFSSEVGNSPSQKIIHMSVINSTDNFEEDKRDVYRRDQRYGDIIKDDQSDSFPKQSNSSSNKPESAKAAVPILDFTGLPKNDRNGSKSENISNDLHDHEIKSNSIGSIFDHDSHMDLSSKRLKKLILTSDFSSLLNLREEALKFKETKERNKIDKLLKNSKISPRTSKNKEFELEKWITKEKAEIKKTKKIIEEARKRTEDVLKEAQINTDFMKQILTDKVMTPREGVSVRSSLNSSRRQYEQKQRESKDDHRLSFHSDNEHEHSSLSQKHSEKYFKKEILYDPNQEQDKSDVDGLVSVDTPQIISDGNSSFNNTKKIKFDPEMLKEKLSEESLEPKIDNNIPINLDIRLKDPSSNNSDSSGPSVIAQNELSGQSLSRKKSENHLKDIKSKLSSGDVEPSDLKLTVTPTPQTKPGLINPFNSDNFFTRDFDDQEMEVAIEQLKNSSGKMYNPKVKSEDERLLNDKTKILKKPVGFDEHPGDSDNLLNPDLADDAHKQSNDSDQNSGESSDSAALKDKIRTNKIVKVKDSRNTEIKESKHNEQLNSDLSKNNNLKMFGDNDVDALRIKTTNKPDTSDSRNEQKRAHEQIVKSNNTNESLKEDIILENISDKPLSDHEDKLEDDKNITGEQSLGEDMDITPAKAISVNDSDLDSEDKTDPNANSDSKYATVSILSEMSKKAKENNDTQTTVSSKTTQDQVEHGHKLVELIYEAMLSEIKSELFPQRPLFLLTADLEKIELEQALIYLNDMSVEKEAALLKEYLKYSEEDALNSWELDNRNERDSNDSNMFSDSGKLVLYERKGISTDLFSIERYVDELSTEVDDK